MNASWWFAGFVVGLCAGGLIGCITMAMLVAASRGSHDTR